MPFVSQAQAGWAHTHPDEFGKKNLKEWDAATKGKHLPKRVQKLTYVAKKAVDGKADAPAKKFNYASKK